MASWRTIVARNIGPALSWAYELGATQAGVGFTHALFVACISETRVRGDVGMHRTKYSTTSNTKLQGKEPPPTSLASFFKRKGVSPRIQMHPSAPMCALPNLRGNNDVTEPPP